MKVGIILAGQPRFNDETISLFNQNIVNKLSINHEVEIFVQQNLFLLNVGKN